MASGLDMLVSSFKFSSSDIVHMNYMAFEPGNWEIAVLALLREAPMHPYQMQRLLRLRHKDDILVLKRGSLYHAIGRLMRAGLIEVEATDREGRRPERTTYRITAMGLEALIDTLRRIVSTQRREPSEFIVAMSFLLHLEPEEAVRRLHERTERLTEEIARLASGLSDASTHIQRINLIESDYLLAMLKAELAWVTAIEKEIQEGRLTWDCEAVFRAAQISRDLAGKKREER
jgi:DNA-binding PadR family transcriptional regulator